MHAGLLAPLVVAISLLPSAGAQAEPALSVRSGFAKTFALRPSGGRLSPGPVREARIGPAEPRPGEIAIGLAPAGHAVGVAKIHVFERSPKAIAFKATAMRGATRLATETVCGRLDLDVWVGLPAATTRVLLSDFAEVPGACR